MNINATIIGQLIFFAVFVWFCARYVWPPMMNAMQQRQKKIAEGLDAADRAAKELQLVQEQVAQQLEQAKVQAAAIMEQANRRAQQIEEEALHSARAKGQAELKKAQSEIEQSRLRLREELRGQVAALAIAGAQKILHAQVDAKAHSQMLDRLAAEL